MAAQKLRLLLFCFEARVANLNVVFRPGSGFGEVGDCGGCSGPLHVADVMLYPEAGPLSISHQVVEFPFKFCFVSVTFTFPVFNVKFLDSCLLLPK